MGPEKRMRTEEEEKERRLMGPEKRMRTEEEKERRLMGPEIRKSTGNIAGRSCDFCGKWSMELKRADALGFRNWICPECLLRLRERALKRGIIAGEHTEPAE